MVSASILLLLGVVAVLEAEETVYKKPEIYSMHIYSDIKYRFATTKITSRVKNPDTKSREAVFDVTLPNEAYITNLTLEVDGKIILGEIKEKAEAKQQYEAAQQRGESAGYIGTQHRETNRFNLAITVSPQSKVSFNLTYQELLKRKHGRYEQVIYIDPGQPVEDMDVTVAILESREITSLRVPPLRNDIDSDLIELNSIAVISQPTSNSAKIKYVPSIEQQTTQTSNGMAGQFVVQYDVERQKDAGEVLVVNGYFVHFFAPEGLKPIPNDVLFILDTSGSMTGTKMRQLKQAMMSILEQLNDGDQINIMTFSGSTSFWKNEMVDIMNEDIMEEAKAHIHSINANGWTNIESALTIGVGFLAGRTVNSDEVRSPVILFLTDGEATNGITDKEQILANVRAANEGEIPIFSLAFGTNADYDLVKKVAIQNNGLGRKIYEASDASMQIAGFYSEIAVTLLSNLTFQYLDAPVSNVTKHEYTNYFNGSECVISGRINDSQNADIPNSKSLSLKVLSNSIDGPNVLVLSNDLDNDAFGFMENLTTTGDYETITEKVWAYLTIKELLDKEMASADSDEKAACNKQILEMSLKYGFVTPLTSMVVTKPKAIEGEDAAEDLVETVDVDGVMDENWPAVAYPKPGSPRSVPLASSGRFASDPVSHYFDQSPQYAQQSMMRPPKMLGMTIPAMVIPQQRAKIAHNAVTTRKRNKQISKGKKGKGNRKRRKNKKRNNKVNGYPLKVQFPKVEKPICFTLYDDALEGPPATYLLYANDEKGVRIEMQLEKVMQGKWTKLGGITKLTVSVNSNTSVILGRTFSQNGTYVRTEGTDTQTVHSGMAVFVFDEFTLNVGHADDEYISIFVKGLTSDNLVNNGVLGDILLKQFQLKIKKPNGAKKSKNANKVFGVLKIKNQNKFAVVMKKIAVPASGLVSGGNECWTLRKMESLFYNMNAL